MKTDITNMVEFLRAQRMAKMAVEHKDEEAWKSAMLLLKISKQAYWREWRK